MWHYSCSLIFFNKTMQLFSLLPVENFPQITGRILGCFSSSVTEKYFYKSSVCTPQVENFSQITGRVLGFFSPCHWKIFLQVFCLHSSDHWKNTGLSLFLPLKILSKVFCLHSSNHWESTGLFLFLCQWKIFLQVFCLHSSNLWKSTVFFSVTQKCFFKSFVYTSQITLLGFFSFCHWKIFIQVFCLHSSDHWKNTGLFLFLCHWKIFLQVFFLHFSNLWKSTGLFLFLSLKNISTSLLFTLLKWKTCL